jgi:hypothetical protein
VYFNVHFNVFFKLIKVHLLVSELYIYQNARCNNKNHSAKFFHSGSKESTLQLSLSVAGVQCGAVISSDSYQWLLLISTLISQNAANPLPRLHSCYQRQAANCCICIHIRQIWFTNSVMQI